MSNYQNYGEATTDNVPTVGVACRGWSTFSAHLETGAGTWTWQFKGPDGEWREVYGGADNATLQSYTATHMVNFFFGGDVEVRGVPSAGTGPRWKWQIIGNVANRG